MSEETAAKVVIYTTATCGFCFAAKRLLAAKSVAFEEIDVAGRADLRGWLREVSQQHTVPQVFINGQSVGGYTELAGLEQRGQLDQRLGETQPEAAPELRR